MARRSSPTTAVLNLEKMKRSQNVLLLMLPARNVDRLMAIARGRSRPSFGKALRSDMRIALSSFGELSFNHVRLAISL